MPPAASGTSTSDAPSVAPNRWSATSHATCAKSLSPDHRLVDYDGQTVFFRYRDRRDADRVKTTKLDAPTFCRSFLQHVLPKGFVRIRRYGLLSNRVRKPMLERCRDLLHADPPLLLAPPGESRVQALRRLFGFEPDLCPSCKLGRLIVRTEWRATRLPLDAVFATITTRAP